MTAVEDVESIESDDAAGARADAWWYRWRIELGLVAITAVLAGAFIGMGAGLYMDDWGELRNVEFGGFWAAAGDDQWRARPVCALLYSLLLGGVGPHPVAFVVILAAINAACAVLFFRILREFFSLWLSAVAAALWLILPNHTTWEVWASVTNVAVSQLLILGSTLLLIRRRPSITALVLAGLGYVCAVFSYEAAVPASMFALVVVPYAKWRRVDVRLLAIVGGSTLAATLWAATHIHPLKLVSKTPVDISPFLSANLGWGVAGFGPLLPLVFMAGLAILAVGAVRLLHPNLRRHAGEAAYAILAGFVILPVGAVGFLFYSYEPIGGGDREIYVSAFGAAMIWAAGASLLRNRQVVAGWVALALIAAVMLPVHWDRYHIWHDAGLDAVSTGQAIAAFANGRNGPIIVGPGTVTFQNFAAFENYGNIEAAAQYYAHNPNLIVRLERDPVKFAQLPAEQRFDICTGTLICARKNAG